MNFNGKRVALIGPAEHTAETYQKDKVNCYDLVVRLNSCYPLNERVMEKTGERTDVLYITGNQIVNSGDLKGVIQVRLAIKHFFSQAFLNTKPYLSKIHKKVQVVNTIGYWGMRNKLGSLPTTGLMALNDIITENPKELYISGMTFYKTPYYKDYTSDYGANRTYKGMKRNIKAGINYKKHNPENEFNYFVENFYCLDNVVCDEVLEDIIKNEH